MVKDEPIMEKLTLKRVLSACVIFMLTQAFFCPGPSEPLKVANVKMNEVSLVLYDTASLTRGARISWKLDTAGSNDITFFTLYTKFEEQEEPQIQLTKIPPELNNLELPFPDTSMSQIFYGIKATVEEGTGQQFESDSIDYGKLSFSSPVINLSPLEDSVVTVTGKTVFTGKPSNDRGDSLRFLVIVGEDFFYTLDTTFPLNGPTQVFPANVITDSFRLPTHPTIDTISVRWCLLATALPGKNLTNLTQSLTCNRFFSVAR